MSAAQEHLPRLRMGARVITTHELSHGNIPEGSLGTVIDAIPGGGPVYYVVRFDDIELAQEYTVSENFIELAPPITFP